MRKDLISYLFCVLLYQNVLSLRPSRIIMSTVSPYQRPKKPSSSVDTKIIDVSRQTSTTTGFATELGASHLRDLVPSSTTNINQLNCYFEKATPCSKASTGACCSVDGRPCTANRDYMDHVYGARFVPKKSVSTQHQPVESMAASTVYDHRFTRSYSVAVPPSFLESILLPDPYQGQSWIVNFFVNTFKITMRAGILLFSIIGSIIHGSTAHSRK
jgi:hypothetical protein